MYEFIKKNVNIRKTKTPQLVTGNIIIIDDEFQIQGSSSLEISKKLARGALPRINFDTFITNTMDKTQIINNKAKFDALWNNKNYTENFKEQLLESLSYVYKDYSPEFLYFFTLNEIFGTQLDFGIERFESDSNRFKKSKIWNTLFEFQKDAVVSAIQKINKYNGCIIADSVGLGKTYEALAVIKYFELRQDNVLVLVPAKLYDNWNSFKSTYVDNPLIDDKFNYKILFHTDLSRTKGDSKSGMDLARVDWSKFDLVVIDESHNFRNRTDNDEHTTRYQRLINEVIKKGQNTKVLLLSATPVNNSLTDLRNQLSIITADKDNAFEEYGVGSVSNLLRNAQKEINEWIDTEKYYIMYIENSGQIYIGNTSAREALKEMRRLCYDKSNPDTSLFKKFNAETKNAEDMSVYSSLLSKSIKAIQGEEDEKAQASIFDFSGFNNEFANSDIDDFELISFLVLD